MVRRASLVASALALIVCAGADANASAPDLSSVLSITAGGAALDSNEDGGGQFDDNSYFTFGGEARVSGENWMVEIFGTSISDTDEDGQDQGSASFGAAAHYLRSVSDRFRWGVLVGAQDTKFHDEDEQGYHVFGALEGAYDINSFTVFGQAGWSHAIDGDINSTWEYGPWARIGGRLFPSPHQRIEAEFTAGFGKYDADEDGHHMSWGLEYEHQLNKGPFSVAAGYRGYYTEDSTTPVVSAVDHVFSLALIVALGGGETVQSRYTTGADRFSAPDFHRAYGYPDDL